MRYRVDPDIWDLPQFASIPYNQLVSEYVAWLSTRTERGGPASPAAIKAARHTLASFRKALVADGGATRRIEHQRQELRRVGQVPSRR